MRRHPLILLLILWLTSSVSHAQTLPEFTATYALERNGMRVGEMVLALRRQPDGSFRYRSRSRATGLVAWFYRGRIEEESHWRMIDGRPRPDSYHYFHNKRKHHRRVDIRFDWSHMTATNTINNDPWKMDIPATAQDKLVYQISLMYDLAAGQKILDYPIADGGILKNYHFSILGNDTLETPLGKQNTIKLRRDKDKRNTTLWCATELKFLPIRIEQKDPDGSRLTLKIKALTGMTGP